MKTWHNINIWVVSYTLQKHLGYFDHILRLSQLHQCDKECYQIGKASLVFSEDLFGYIPGISTTKHATKELRACRCVSSKQQHTSPEMLIYKFSKKIHFFNKRGKHLNYTSFKL